MDSRICYWHGIGGHGTGGGGGSFSRRPGGRLGFLPLLLGLLMAVPGAAGAFSGEDMDRLLEMEEVTVQAAYGLVEEAAVSSDSRGAEALRERFGRKARGEAAEEPVSLGTFSFMLMEAFSIQGGIMYSLIPSGRYASRELAFLGYIREDSGAYRRLSGREALGIVGRVVQGEAAR